MKLNTIAIAALSAVFSVNVPAAVDEDQMAAFKADCHKYAQEDGVAGDQVEDYVAQCVQDLATAQSENVGNESAESGKE